MENSYSYKSGPAVGVENGTLLIGWPARLKTLAATAPFNLLPLAAQWTAHGSLRIIVLQPDGTADNLDVIDLQFDPKGKSKK